MSITTTKFHKHEMALATFERVAVYIETLPDRLLQTLYVWQRRNAERRRLAQLDERTLLDIGIERTDIEQETGKPFWRA